MALLLINQTSNSLSYAGGQVTVPANGSAILSPGLAPYVALDGKFLNDTSTKPPNVMLSDGVNSYSGSAAQSFLNMWLNGGPPQTSNDPIAFTLAGQGFALAANSSLANTTETPLLYIVNPAGSGVNARLMYSYSATDSTQGILTTRIYINPTVSQNGTQIYPQNSLISSSSPASAMNVYAAPTVSANGALRFALVTAALTTPEIHDFKQTAILTPGNAILVTAQAANLGLLSSLSTHAYLHWVEV